MATPATSDHLRQLLAPPSPTHAQQQAVQLVHTSLPHPLSPVTLAHHLAPLVASQHALRVQLEHQLGQSSAQTSALLARTLAQLQSILARADELKGTHDALEDALIDHREALVSKLSSRESGEAEKGAEGREVGEGLTLKDRLQRFAERRVEIDTAKQWFAVLVKAEQLGSVPVSRRASAADC